MRFDLTNASYRVLQRAEKIRLQPGISSISAAKILLALLDEEECRAAKWLGEKGVFAENFSAAAQKALETAILLPKPFKSQLRFYADDQQIHVSKLEPELESVLNTIAYRLARTERRKESFAANGAVRTITGNTLQFTIATEHLLLAAVLDNGFTGQFLRDSGFDAAELYQQIDSKLKVDSGELEIDNGELEVDEVHSTQPSAAMRLIDAAANRSKEAVRVLEDYVRFILDDADATRQFKTLRHALQNALSVFSLNSRLAVRDTKGDVGTGIEVASEYERTALTDVLTANFNRLQESLRSLEEYSKLSEPAAARQFEQLRYASYTLQKAFNAENEKLKGEVNCPLSTFMVLVDCRPSEDAFATLITQLSAAGVGAIQLRDKNADDRTLLARAKQIRKLAADILLIINDRVDIAVAAGADGVHVGQTDLSVADVRKIAGNGLVGVSTHNIAQSRQAAVDGADYIGVGPVFASSTKDFTELAGLDFCRSAAQEISVPVFAIGGITADNIDSVLATGIQRIAAAAAVVNADHPQAAAEELQKHIREGIK